jgi:hypothetical protein
MLAYVDRFACDWHRFSTTDLDFSLGYYTSVCIFLQAYFCKVQMNNLADVFLSIFSG